MRYFIRLQYDGTSFFGWQKLKNFPTVQGTIEKALSTLLQKTILIHGCGRTDRGVHAQEYFAHVDLPVIEISSLLYRVNQLLPNSIRIINFHLVPDNAHAQLDSICRTYQYRIHTKKNPFIYPFSYWYQKNLDSKLLEDASQIILRGEDFQNFTKSPQRQNSTKCKIHRAEWDFETSGILVFTISADHFLKRMIRILVAKMLEIASGNMRLEEFRNSLDNQIPQQFFHIAPPQGLHLVEISYPDGLIPEM